LVWATIIRPWGITRDNNVALSYDAPVYVVVARSDGDFTEPHHFDGSGRRASSRPIQLFVAATIKPNEEINQMHLLLLIHTCLMFLAFAVLVPIGSFIGRFLKPLGRKWFLTHRALHAVAGVLALIALTCVVMRVQLLGEEHFEIIDADPHMLVRFTLLAPTDCARSWAWLLWRFCACRLRWDSLPTPSFSHIARLCPFGLTKCTGGSVVL
jgi:hypothetical protein